MVGPVVERRTIEVPGGTVRSRRVSAGGIGRPVLFLHGGPGGSSDGFAVFEGLAADRDLVLFDQLGSRTSTWSRGDDRRLWTMDRFCREVDAVRGAWGLDEVVLYGHSWGGWLGLEYLARGADGVTAVVLADTTAAFTTFAASIERRVRELSPSSRAAIAAARRTGSLDTPEYRAAAIEFYSRFVVGFVDDPVTTADAVLDRQRSSAVFQHMQGADELHADGALATWDRRDSLGAIRVPALVVVGEHDHMDVGCATELRDGLAWAELLVVERASHCPHLERPDVVLDRVGSWLPA